MTGKYRQSDTIDSSLCGMAKIGTHTLASMALAPSVRDAYAAFCAADLAETRDGVRTALRVTIAAVEKGDDRTQPMLEVLSLLEDARLEDVHLLSGQLFVLLSESAYATAATLPAWPALGVIRASVIACRVRPLDHGAAEDAIVDMYARCRADFDASAYLCSVLVDTLDAMYAEGRRASDRLYDTVLAPLVAMRSDLVTHRLARLAATLAAGDARRVVAFLSSHAGPETRLLYLAAQQLLQSPALAAVAADLRTACHPSLSAASLMLRIISDSAMAPSACDCLVALLATGHEDPASFAAALVAAERPSEGSDNVARFLLPRLAKRASGVSKAVMAALSSGKIVPRTDAIAAYAAIGAALLWGGSVATTALAGTLDVSIVSEALLAPVLATRLAAFQMLCRAGGGQAAPFDTGRAKAVYGFIFQSLLAAGSAARQQTAAALAAMFAGHISRLYLLARSGLLVGEGDDICAFWTSVVALATSALPTEHADMRMYHRTDAALRLLLVLVRIVVSEWTPQAYPQNREPITGILARVFAPLERALPVVLDNVAANPYDASQAMAAELYAAFGAMVAGLGQSCALFAVDDVRLESAFDTLGTSRRPFELDGASRILCLAADQRAIWRRLCLRLSDDSDALTGPSSFEVSGAIGTLLAIGAYMPSLQSKDSQTSIQVQMEDMATDLQQIATCCLRICRAVIAHLTHPTPEGCTSLLPDEDASDEEEDAEVGDAYTAMAFCWRAAKHSTLVLVDALALISRSVKAKERMEDTQAAEAVHSDKDSSFGANLNTCPDEISPVSVANELAQMLMDVRHPGVFTALADPLARVVRMCSDSDVSVLLDVVLQRCVHHEAITTTRRSGGLPLCVSAVVSYATNPSSSLPNRLLLRAVDLVTACAKNDDAPVSARVHALNILRHLSKDTGLADAFRRHHLAVSFEVALKAFHDQDWAVRNSGMLLFAALMTRTFGVSHDADPLALKKDHCDSPAQSDIIIATESLRIAPRDALLATNVADVRSIKCDPLLLLMEQRMRAAAAPESVARWSSDYVSAFAVCPLVAFALRVRYPPGALDAVQLRLRDATLALLLATLGSRILKIRLMAARVLQRMAADGVDVASCVLRIASSQRVSSNALHGALLFAYGNAELSGKIAETASARISQCPYLADLATGVMPKNINLDNDDQLIASVDDVAQHVGKIALYDKISAMRVAGYGAERSNQSDNQHIHTCCASDELRGVLQRIGDRAVPMDQLANAIQAVACLGNDAHIVFEAFWTGVYDVAGSYRHALVSAWTPDMSKLLPRWRRLMYLALTDDDAAIRLMAADGRFDAHPPISPAAALEQMLRYSDAVKEIGELLEWMPTAQSRVVGGRDRLFDAEPLNTYKDIWWQRQIHLKHSSFAV